MDESEFKRRLQGLLEGPTKLKNKQLIDEIEAHAAETLGAKQKTRHVLEGRWITVSDCDDIRTSTSTSNGILPAAGVALGQANVSQASLSQAQTLSPLLSFCPPPSFCCTAMHVGSCTWIWGSKARTTQRRRNQANRLAAPAKSRGPRPRKCSANANPQSRFQILDCSLPTTKAQHPARSRNRLWHPPHGPPFQSQK